MKERTDETVVGVSHENIALRWSDLTPEFRDYFEGIERENADLRRLVWAATTPSSSVSKNHATGMWEWGNILTGRYVELGNGPLPVLTDEARKAIDEAMEATT